MVGARDVRDHHPGRELAVALPIVAVQLEQGRMRTLRRFAVIPQVVAFAVPDFGRRLSGPASCSCVPASASCAVVGASMAGRACAILGGVLGLLLADHVFRNYRFIR
jgi:hypothetical protein